MEKREQNEENGQQQYNGQPYDQRPFTEQPYGQQNRQPNYGTYNQPPYNQSPYNQSPYNQPPKKKSVFPFILAGGAVIILLLLGGIIFALISKKSTSTSNQNQTVNQGDSGQQITEEKIPVQDDTFQTVVTAKSVNLDNIQLFTTAGGAQKAGKVQEGVPCALLQQQDVNGEQWAKIDFCNRQGWCRMDMLRTISGDAKYFYVKANSVNTVFVNENSIKLHTGVGKKTDIAATGVTYGTELNILEVQNGWGRTMYQNQECWIDMNVVGFYASDYWQVERCDGSTTGIKLRESANEKSKELAVVPLKTVLQSSEFKNGWAKFSYSGKTGWMKLHYATPCGSTSGLSFSEDKTEATTEAKAEVKTAAKSTENQKPKVKFGYEISPIAGYCYIPDEKEYMIISNVTDSQFDFEIYNVDGLCFKHHTAVAVSSDTAKYYGEQYTLTFNLDEEGIVVNGFDVIGPDAYFTYEEYLDNGEDY